MDVGLINLFKDATVRVLDSCGIEDVKMVDMRPVTGGYNKIDGIGMAVPFYGDLKGLMACVLHRSNVINLARMLTEQDEVETDAEFLSDVVAELVNVIIGHVVNEFGARGMNVDFSTPEPLGQDGVKIDVPQGFECFELKFVAMGAAIEEVVILRRVADA